MTLSSYSVNFMETKPRAREARCQIMNAERAMHRQEPPQRAKDMAGRDPGAALLRWEAISISLGIPQPAEASLERLLDRLEAPR